MVDGEYKGAWCLLLTGMPNSGKSTIAYELRQRWVRNVLVIDGDRHREMQFLGRKLGFSEQDIRQNTAHVIKVAKFVQRQAMNVIIAQIAPYGELREWMAKELRGFYEVYCRCDLQTRKNRPNFVDSELVYELGGYNLMVDTASCSVEKCCEQIFNSPWGREYLAPAGGAENG